MKNCFFFRLKILFLLESLGIRMIRIKKNGFKYRLVKIVFFNPLNKSEFNIIMKLKEIKLWKF
jgi:hypothetical protein